MHVFKLEHLVMIFLHCLRLVFLLSFAFHFEIRADSGSGPEDEL